MWQGEPVGFWPGGKSCDLTKHLDPHNLIINLTLCGSWAGNTFNADGCPGHCESTYLSLRTSHVFLSAEFLLREPAYVEQNPAAFKNAFFDIAWVKVYA